MEMRKALVAIAFLAFACNEEVSVEDIFSDFKLSAETIPADGQSTIDVSVNVNENSSADRRTVLFKTTGGAFTTSEKSEQSVKAIYVEGVLMAKARLRAPISDGAFKITVEPEFNSPIKTYSLEKNVTTTPSVATKILVETSATGIAPNAGTEVRVTGTLLNASGRWVTKNTTVEFQDMIGSGSAGGIFRNAALTSSDTSTVVAWYAASNHAPGTQITITVRLKDSNVVSEPVKLIVINQ